MARLPKSAAEKALTGAGRRAKAQSPVSAKLPAKPKTFPAPEWMKRADARAVWARVVPELARVNIMTDVFRDVVARYCVHFADWVKLSKNIDKVGATLMVKMTHSDEKMPRVNPAIRVRDTVERSLIDIEDRFGLSPLARYRIVAHQAAHPGQRDLFRDDAPAKPDGQPNESPPPRASPIGALRPTQIN